MTVSIFDPTTKMLIVFAQSAIDRQLDMVASHHAGDAKVADAIRAARAAIDGAINALVSLQ
jgi:hypothetical protein